MRIAYLGPAGTFTEDALRRGGRRRASSSRCARRPSTTRSSPSSAARPSGPWSPSRTRSRARCAAPSTRSPSTREAVTIVGEHDYAVRAHADRPRGSSSWTQIEAVLSHPQPLAQCARFLREQLPGAERRSVSSTAEAVRDGQRVGAALGGDRRPRRRRALRLHDPARGDRGRGRQRHPLRLDRPGRHRARAAAGPGRPRWSSPSSARTTPARWSTPCSEFSGRGVNLTRIESRPLRQGLGRYMFFCDLEGALADEPVAAAIEALREQGRIGPDPGLLPGERLRAATA